MLSNQDLAWLQLLISDRTGVLAASTYLVACQEELQQNEVRYQEFSLVPLPVTSGRRPHPHWHR